MPQRLPPRLQQAYEASRDRTLQAAADVARGVHGASAAPSARQLPREIRGLKLKEATALREWAHQEQLVLDADEFEQLWQSQDCIGGQENDVFLKGNRVFKRNNLSFHLCYADFLDRIALHNLLFPGARLRFEGFVEHGGEFRPVMSQPAVRARRGAIRTEVEALMQGLGFKRIRNDDYRHPEGILVEDLHDENVFIDENEDIVVIDPVIYLAEARPVGKKSSFSSRHPSRKSLV